MFFAAERGAGEEIRTLNILLGKVQVMLASQKEANTLNPPRALSAHEIQRADVGLLDILDSLQRIMQRHFRVRVANLQG